MEIGKKNILTLAMLAALTPPLHMHAMDNNEQEERKEEAAAAAEAMAPQAAAVAMPFTPEQIELANKALIEAVESNDVEAAQTALNNGANPNIYDKQFNYPLLIVAAHSIIPDKPEIVELLLSHGADINAVTHNDLTALDSESRDSLKVLLSHHADVNKKNKNNSTPLLRIADSIAYWSRQGCEEKFYIEIAEMFICAGADLTLTNNDHKTIWNILNEAPTKKSLYDITAMYTTKQATTNQLNKLKTFLQEAHAQNPLASVNELIRLRPNRYCVTWYSGENQHAYELLNKRTAEQWNRIKAEVEAARLLNKYHLKVQDITNIVLGYLAFW